MRFTVATIFPEMISAYLEFGILSRAAKEGLIEVKTINIRDYAVDRYGHIDSNIFGHGKGMLFRCEPLKAVIESVQKEIPDTRVILMSPQGKPFTNRTARRLSKEKNVLLIAARYEGIDNRIIEKYVDEEISVGDYVLTGGELPALTIIDAVSRFVEGSIKTESADDESFENGLLEYSHYTEPLEFEGMKVPEVLRSGDHGKMDEYRKWESIRKTFLNRPDLLMQYYPVETESTTADPLKALKRKNRVMREFLNNIEKIAEEWKDVRRNESN